MSRVPGDSAARGRGKGRKDPSLNRAVLCDAVRQRFVVQLRYAEDRSDRVFAPHVVYRSSAGNLLVGGVQIHNPAAPLADGAIRELRLSGLRSLRVTADRFEPDNRFDFRDPRYRAGLVCRVAEP